MHVWRGVLTPRRVQVSLTQRPGSVCRPQNCTFAGGGPSLGACPWAHSGRPCSTNLFRSQIWPEHTFEALTQAWLGSAHSPGADLGMVPACTVGTHCSHTGPADQLGSSGFLKMKAS